MAKTLFVLKSSDDGQSILVDKDIIIGRDPKCAVVLEQGQASRQHAKLSPDPKGIKVEDLNSTNGTAVNGKKITTPVVLKPGGELRIGNQRFTAVAAGDPQKADPEATMLFEMSEATVREKAGAGEADAFEDTVPEAQAASEEKSPPKARNPLADSNAPPSWVLSNQQAVDGTKFIDKKVMQDVLQQSSGAVQEKVNAPTLIGSSDPITGMRFQLGGDGVKQWEIGRATSCQVMINHDSVSSSHAQIINEGGRWKLIDLMSANGTYINAKKGLSSYLNSGDVLRFGQVECTFRLPEHMAKKAAAKKVVVNQEEKKGGGTLKTALLAFVVTGAVIAAVVIGLSFLA